MQIYWTPIRQIVQETPEVKTYVLAIPEGFTWEEGAHTHFALEGFDAGEKPDRSLIRHMSISTLPKEHSIGITTRIRDKRSAFKAKLNTLHVGDQVALFKTHSNVPLKRENHNVYLLSSGVGLATFRPLILTYLTQGENIDHMHSLNIDSSEQFLFSDDLAVASGNNFTSRFVNNRKDYYDDVRTLAKDANGLFYIVGSDDFLRQNIDILQASGVRPEQIMLDKHDQQLHDFLEIKEDTY